VIVGRPNYANGQITFNQAVLRPLIEVISRSAITAGIDDVTDEIAPQHKTLAGKAVNTGTVVELLHRVINQIVLNAVVLPAPINGRVGRLVNFVVADFTIPAATLQSNSAGIGKTNIVDEIIDNNF
jgi:hypothetical protein